VRHPLAEIVTVFPGDNQHPLYSILARLCVLAFGEHAWSLRLPAVVFGVASVPALYFLAASVASRMQALLAAAFLAVSYHHVWFSQNARGYSALAFFTIVSTYFLLVGLRTGRRGPYIAYAFAAALGAYTHLAMMFLIASHVMVCAGSALADLRAGRSLAKWKITVQAFVLTAGLTLLFYAPIIIQVQKFFLKGPSGMKAFSTPRWAFLEIIRGLTLGMGTAGVLVVAAVVVACGAWSYFKQDRVVFALLVLPGMLTLGSVAVRGTMYPRFYFYLIGFAVMILVRGIVVVPQWIAPRLATGVTAVFAVGFLISSAVALAHGYEVPKQDFDGAIDFVSSEMKTGEIVATAGAATYPLQEYYGMSGDSADTPAALDEICNRNKTVWLIYTFPRYMTPELRDDIRSKFSVIQVFHGTVGDGDVSVARYLPK
jgi:mannosyltransferase